VLAFSTSSSRAAGSKQIGLDVDYRELRTAIPPDFLGLGMEISSVAVSGLLSARNQAYVQFVRTLAGNGVIRIGGNTSDLALWEPEGNSIALPRGTVTNQASISDLGGFLQATGWKLIWGLNMGTGTPESAADQAVAVAAAAGGRLLCFEFGNEPDLFVLNGFRPNGYSYGGYYADFQRFAASLANRLPGAPLGGPSVLASTDWVNTFAHDEGTSVKLLTEHYYINDAGTPFATLSSLLSTDPRFVNMIGQLQSDSQVSGVPYRLVEFNSFTGGGKPGVSDVFASALWGLDIMFVLASAGGAGINWETGLNHLGFVSSYSPIYEDIYGNFSARPLYYALLAFGIAAGGQLVKVQYDSGDMDLTAYAFRASSGQPWLALINKDLSTGAEVQVKSSGSISWGEMWWLAAPAFDSAAGVTFGGAEVSAAGIWTPGVPQALRAARGKLTIAVPPASALLVRLLMAADFE
jgi:hypothetical protein